ncbi:hypothetical protein [Spirosoma oryzicola]|uniref:hypothetical protein n=1 Tax=Spirosoma oryzicola TaxID=2898794 RepID=UPI001E630FF7|nr:hypothetical protein [Spirosoma oryzicola]UHG92540.1 hypothetical protein LQ777_06435 [Spirosoma oryzicola]
MNTPANTNETPQNAPSQIVVNSKLTLTREDSCLVDMMNHLPMMNDTREEVRNWFLAYVERGDIGTRSCDHYKCLDDFFSAIILKLVDAQKGGQANV